MSNISDRNNEYEFVKYFNNKKIKDLNPLAKDFITKLYGDLNKNLEIKSWCNHLAQKNRHIYKNKWYFKRNKYKKRYKKFCSY